MALAVVAVLVLAALRLWGGGVLAARLDAPYGDIVVHTIGVLLAVAVAFLIDRLIRAAYWNGYHRRRRKREIPTLIEDLLTVALVVIGVCVGLYFEVGLSATGIFTASGATAIVIGIALQTVIQDMFSGLSVNLDQSYAIGDWLTIYAAELPEPVYGCVAGINWRTTYLRLPDSRLLMVPNRLVTSNSVLNHSRPLGAKRLSVEIAVDIRVPAERVASILLGETIKAVRQPGLSATPEPVVLVNRLSADATFFEIRFFSNPNEIEPQVARSAVLYPLQIALNQFQLAMPVTQIELTPPPDVEAHWDDEAIRSALRRIALFRGVLDEEHIAALAARCKPADIARQTAFIRQGEDASSMFVMLEGVARVMVARPTGDVQQVATLTGGDVVGEMSLMTGAPRTATVVAGSALRALEITKESFGALLKDSPELLERFSHVLAQRQAELDELANRATSDAHAQSALLANMRAFFARFF